LAIILLGLVNFVAFVVGYVFIGGDAFTGGVDRDPANPNVPRYCIDWERTRHVARETWIYSAVHSISVWPTMGAVLLAMLTLGKDRIVSAMHSTVMRGRTFMTILATLIAFIVVVMTAWFVLAMIRALTEPGGVGS
jgi:hypothetical protein